MIKALPRIRSVDAFRAVTMFLMIFLNDIEDIPNTPMWMHHVADDVDGMGLADVIFPAFLFIVGLAIPISQQNRSTQQSNLSLHIIRRAAVLIFWGFLFTNGETYDNENTIIQHGTWLYLSILSMFLIFLDYSKVKPKWIKYTLQGAGALLLIFLLTIYKSEDPEQPWLHFTWWGILGLIGWAYLYAALIFHFSGGKLWVQVIAWALFVSFNILARLAFTDFLYPFFPHVWLAGNGAMQAFTMAGVIIALCYRQAWSSGQMRKFWLGALSSALIIGVLGIMVKDVAGGISKAYETPAWVAVCTSACILAYLAFVFIVDIRKKYNWVKPIEAAGMATLTCFMLPDLFYSWFETTDFDYPEFVKSGMGGVLRGIAFSFITIWVTALLLKLNIRLKI